MFFKQYKPQLVFFFIAIIGAIILLSRGLPERKVHVLVSIPPLAPIVQELVGKMGTVEVLLPEGNSPKEYMLTYRDRERLRGADYFFMWGMGVDTYIDKENLTLPFSTMRVEVVGEKARSLVERQNKTPPSYPYFWWDSHYLPYVRKVISDDLVEWDLKASGYFQIQREKYKQKDLEMSIQTKEMMEKQGDKVILVHDVHTAAYLETFGFVSLLWDEDNKEEFLKQLLTKYRRVTIVDAYPQQRSSEYYGLYGVLRDHVSVFPLPLQGVKEKSLSEQRAEVQEALKQTVLK